MFSLKCMRVLRCIFPPFMHVALTSPDDRTLFMYSRKDSSLISLSVKMKLAPLPCWPAVLYKPFRSSIKLAVLYDLAWDGAHKRCFSSQKRLTIYSSESPAVIQWESPNPLPLQKDRGRKTSRCLRMMRHEWNVHAKPPEKTQNTHKYHRGSKCDTSECRQWTEEEKYLKDSNTVSKRVKVR